MNPRTLSVTVSERMIQLSLLAASMVVPSSTLKVSLLKKIPEISFFLQEKSHVRGCFLPVAPWLLTVNPRELPYDNPSLTSPAGGIE